jgi:regulatory factor X
MVRFVSRLTLQAAPVIVINVLSNISSSLHGHIAKTFSSQPQHVLEAKLRPATIFASLLHRLIRVNQSAHAAANLLTIDHNREQMWREWLTMVNPKRVMEAELPDCGYEEVYKILTSEMRGLLEPLQAPSYQDDPYGFTAYNFEENGSFAQFLQSQTGSSVPGSRAGASAVSTENVLDRWSAFISSLPTRFPQAKTRTLLHCISAIGTAALRDITIMNGASYGHWWVLKIFVDEMALWLAEMGGFLEPAVGDLMNGHSQPVGSVRHSPVENGNSHANGSQGSRSLSRVSSFGPNEHAQPGNGNSSFASTGAEFQQSQSQNLAFHTHGQGNGNGKAEADIDDSGIGMSLMDEEMTFSKFTNPGAGMQVDAL